MGKYPGDQLSAAQGRCARCHGSISPRYPLTELACGLLSAFIAWHYGFGWPAAGVLLLSWGLLAMSLIDADHQLLPDVLVLPLLWLGLILNYFELYVTLPDAVLGAVAGYLSLWSVFWLFKLCTGKDGMGYGDFKLLALLGAWGGWQILPLTLLLASLVGAIAGVIVLRMRNAQTSVPCLWPLSGDCRLDCIALGWSNNRLLFAVCRFQMTTSVATPWILGLTGGIGSGKALRPSTLSTLAWT